MIPSKAVGTVIGLSLVGSFAYLAATPYISIYQFREALEQRDLPAIEQHVNFALVRESLKEQLKAKMIEEIGRRSEGNSWLNLGLGTLSYAIAGPMIDAAVDVYVSPAGMKALLAGTEPAMPDGNQSDAFLPSNKTNHPGVATDVQLSYKTPNLFVISAKDSTPQYPTIKFNFERANLIDWKLTSISLP